MSAQQPRPRDGNAEAKRQAGIVEYIRTVAPSVFIFHIPNGGLRTKAEAARLKWMGTVPGIPDLALVLPGGQIRFIEVKTDTGRLSAEQVTIHAWLVSIGNPAAICTSIDDTRNALKHWGIPTKELVR